MLDLVRKMKSNSIHIYLSANGLNQFDSILNCTVSTI